MNLWDCNMDISQFIVIMSKPCLLLLHKLCSIWLILLQDSIAKDPGGLTCWETCPDVCFEKCGKWVLFWPEMRELRDPQNGCQIGLVPLYVYSLCKIP